MNLLELERARSRMEELRTRSADVSRGRRLYLARRAARRAERAVQRAARAEEAAQAGDAVG
jgi:cob(I)alamin adenosyltransferase